MWPALRAALRASRKFWCSNRTGLPHIAGRETYHSYLMCGLSLSCSCGLELHRWAGNFINFAQLRHQGHGGVCSQVQRDEAVGRRRIHDQNVGGCSNYLKLYRGVKSVRSTGGVAIADCLGIRAVMVGFQRSKFNVWFVTIMVLNYIVGQGFHLFNFINSPAAPTSRSWGSLHPSAT